MKNFKRKSIGYMLAGGLCASGMAMAQQAEGVHVNSDGIGQVLLFPYYTTRNGLDTYVSVVNTTNQAKAVKVRFIESRNSREVLDFNLFMSPFDMWTGAVVAAGSGADSGAKLVTFDKSCTAPQIPNNEKAFRNSAYIGSIEPDDILAPGIYTDGDDLATDSLDRTREGYIEIIEMGTIGQHSFIKGDDGDTYYEAFKHVNGVPKNCSVVSQAIPPARLDLGPPDNGLTGTASIVSPVFGTDFSYDPVALAGFSNDEIYHVPGSIEPDLRHGGYTSVVFNNHQVVQSNWYTNPLIYADAEGDSLNSVNAVNAVLMHNSIINEYVLDSDTLAGTDWVITMPTKRYSVPIYDKTKDPVKPPTYPPFVSTFGANGACEPIAISYWNREEEQVYVDDFSPPQDEGGHMSLCWEANVITFNGSNVLGSAHSENVPVAFDTGWAAIDLHDPARGVIHKLESADTDTHDKYFGLPVIGFAVTDFENQYADEGKLATYGGSFIHKYTTLVEPGVVGTGCKEGQVGYQDGCIDKSVCINDYDFFVNAENMCDAPTTPADCASTQDPAHSVLLIGDPNNTCGSVEDCTGKGAGWAVVDGTCQLGDVPSGIVCYIGNSPSAASIISCADPRAKSCTKDGVPVEGPDEAAVCGIIPGK